MGRAYGSDARILGMREAVPGTAATGNYLQVPFKTCDLGSEQPLVDDPVIGFGRDPIAPFQDVISDKGTITVPMDLRTIGWWLTLAMGPPATTGVADPYEHVWTSGGDRASLPLATLEVQHPAIPAYYQHIGVAVGGLSWSWSRSGGAECSVELIARKETKLGSTGGGTPTSLLYRPISQFKGSIKKDGTLLANITAGSLKYSNELDEVQTIRDDAGIEAADATLAKTTGGLTARFADTALIDLASAGTPVDLEYAYTLSASRGITWRVQNVYLPKPKTSIRGPGGIEAQYNWQAAQDPATSTPALTITLTNDLDGTDYTAEG